MTPAIFGLCGTILSLEERAFFCEANPAGYILFNRNIDTKAQLRALTDDIRAIHGRDVLISIDQEGGRVQRMKAPNWPVYPAGEAFDKLYEIAPISAIEAARVNAEALGADLAEVGINLDYHPPLDLRRPDTHDVIGDRALGSDPMRVAALGRAILEGLGRAGVVGCLKHMPGHGLGMADSHKELPTVTVTADELQSDLEPFRSLSDCPVGMTAHLLFTAWDKTRPATHSPAIIADIIRGNIGFDGLLLTDDIDMEALEGSVPERGEKSIAAGCDVVLNCWAKMDDMAGLAERLPVLSICGHKRLDRALAAAGKSVRTAGHAELIAKRDALLALADNSA